MGIGELKVGLKGFEVGQVWLVYSARTGVTAS